MEDRTSGTEGKPSDADAPTSVSNQNREEAQPGLDDDQPDAPREDEAQGGARERGRRSESGGRVGGAGEGSQATGHPDNAG